MADFVVADTDSEIIMNFVRRDGSPYDLTNKTAQIRWRIAAGSSQISDMDILVPIDGKAKFIFDNALYLNGPGQMYVEAIVTDIATGRVITTAEISQLTVRARA